MTQTAGRCRDLADAVQSSRDRFDPTPPSHPDQTRIALSACEYRWRGWMIQLGTGIDQLADRVSAAVDVYQQTEAAIARAETATATYWETP